MDSDTYQLTQESLATMLGVRRAGVSLVAQTLQSAGLIEYRHGKVTIKDRVNLERVSCECYSVVRRAYDKLNSTSPGGSKVFDANNSF
jgi:DNA-binding transcriptional regulator YhcF (GntR family)